MKTKLIKVKDKRLGAILHRDEHLIIEKKEPKHGVEYYYLMASWLYHDIKGQLNRIEKQLDEIKKPVEKKKKKKLSEYNLFVRKNWKEGLSFADIAKMWNKAKKNRKK